MVLRRIESLSSGLILGLVWATAVLSAEIAPPDSNVTLVGRWAKGECWTVAARGDTVFVANGADLDVVDWTDPEHPQPLGSVSLSGPIASVRVRGSLAYLAGSVDGVVVLDVRDLRLPQVLGTCPLLHSPYDLDVEGGYAYVAVGDSGLCVVDVSDSTNPRLVGRAAIPGLWFRGVAVQNGFAYVAADYSGGLRIFDVQDPTHPVAAGSLRVDGRLRRLVVRDTLVYGVEDSDALVVVNVADPGNPRLLSRLNRHGRDVCLFGDLVCLAGDDEFHVIDVTDPAAPHEVGFLDLAGRPRVKRLAVSGQRAYLSDARAGVWALDLADPSRPELLGLFATPGRTEKIVVADGFAFLSGGSRATSTRGVAVLDLRDPARPREVGGRILSDYLVLDIAYANGVLFVAVGDRVDSILCVDVRNPESPQRLGSFGPIRATALAAVDSLLFAAGTDEFHREVLYVLDIRDPHRPAKIGGRLLKVQGEIWDVVVEGGFAYIARGGGGLQILDVHDPTSPKRVGHLVTTALAGGVAVRGSFAFLADRYPSGLLSVVDVSDPANPVEKTTYDLGAACYGIAASDPFLYVAASARGLRVLDVRDPANPVEVGYFDTPGLAMAVVADTDLVYVADGPAGVLILRNEAVPARVSHKESETETERVAIRSYPNPSNSTIRLEIQVGRSAVGELAVYDTRGRKICTLVSGLWTRGTHIFRWNGEDEAGSPLPSGVYLVRLQAGGRVAVQKVVLVR